MKRRIELGLQFVTTLALLAMVMTFSSSFYPVLRFVALATVLTAVASFARGTVTRDTGWVYRASFIVFSLNGLLILFMGRSAYGLAVVATVLSAGALALLIISLKTQRPAVR